MAADAGLILSAALLGAASIPHCAAMCSVPCRSLGFAWGSAGVDERAAGWTFFAGRALGYASLGLVISLSVAQLAAWADLSAALKPLWHLSQLIAACWGAFLLLTGRQPHGLSSWSPAGLWSPAPTAAIPPLSLASARGPALEVVVPVSAIGGRRGGRRGGRWSRHVRALGVGFLWSLWPCSLLQSALVLAALTSSPSGGAAVMLSFALASAPGLWFGLGLLRRVSGSGVGDQLASGLVRLAGLLMLSATLWAVARDVWPPFANWCQSAW